MVGSGGGETEEALRLVRERATSSHQSRGTARGGAGWWWWKGDATGNSVRWSASRWRHPISGWIWPSGTRAGLPAPEEGARLGSEMIPWRDGPGGGGGWASASFGAQVENSPLAGTRLAKSEGPPLAPASLNAGSLG